MSYGIPEVAARTSVHQHLHGAQLGAHGLGRGSDNRRCNGQRLHVVAAIVHIEQRVARIRRRQAAHKREDKALSRQHSDLDHSSTSALLLRETASANRCA